MEGYPMTEKFIGPISEFKDGDCRIIEQDGLEIGVYRWRGRFYAYRNHCFHQGGPVCEGMLLGKVEDVIAADRTHLGQRFNDDDPHMVCPWHGWEFRLLTGESATDPRLRLQQFTVVERGAAAYVVL
jgi:nitrite reductase (NADH) small subunit